MPRLLLGVSGGIAAYKALEVVRLATGGRPRRARDPDARVATLRRRRVVRGAERRPGAVRAPSSATRCAAPIPGDPLPDHDPAGPPRAGRRPPTSS